MTLTGVTVTDPLTGLTCPVGTLAPGQTDTTCSALYTLTQADVNAGSRANTATASGKDPDNATVTDDDTATVPLPKAASISLTKSATLHTDVVPPDNRADAGDKISYAFSVTNTGNVTLTGVTVADPLTGLSCPVGTLAPGQTDTTTCSALYTLTQADVNAGSRANTATVGSTDPDGDPVTDNDTATVPLPKAASISLTKSATLHTDVVPPNDRADAGDTISYSFTVKNTGNVTLTGLVVTDPLTGLGCAVGTLQPGQTDTTCSALYTLTQADVNAGTRANTATASGKDPDNATVSDDDTATVPLPKAASISLVKTATLHTDVVPPDNRADAGDTISYAFSVTNTGNVTLTGVTVTDPLTSTTCPIGTLAPGQTDTTCSASHILTQADVNAGSVFNKATVSSNDPDGDPVTDDDTATTPLPKAASISLVKTPTLHTDVVPPDDRSDAGDTISYAFAVTNTGNVTLTDIKVTDPLTNLSCTVGELAPGQTDTSCSTLYTLTQGDVNAGSVFNKATASGNDPNGDPVSDDDTATVPLPKNPLVLLVKGATLDMTVAGPSDRVDAGDTIHYGFAVTNKGNVTLTGVTVTDPLTGTSCLIGTLAPGQTDTTTCSATYTLTQADVDAGSRANTATVSGNDPDGDPVTDDDTATVPLPKSASISLTKSATLHTDVVAPDDRADAGDKISYAFSVKNTGNVTLTGVTVTDPLTGLTCPVGTLAPGQTHTTCSALYTLTQADVNAGSRANTATASGKDPNNATVTDDDTATVPLPKAASISLTKSATLHTDVVAPDDRADAGDKISLRVQREEHGQRDADRDRGVGSVDGSELSGWRRSSRARPTRRARRCTRSTQADVNAGSRANTATASGKDPDNATVSDDDTATVPLPKAASISLTKSATLHTDVVVPNDRADAGDTISYAFGVKNTGNVTVTGIVVTDPLTGLSCPVGTLAPGQTDTTCSALYTLTQADVNAGSRANTATASGKDPDNATVTDDDTATVPLPKAASISLDKSATLHTDVVPPNDRADAGDTISYAFSVTNTGNVTLTGVTVTDPLTSTTCPIGTLAPGQTDTTTCSAIHTLTQADVNAGSVFNKATASGNDPDGDPVSDDDTATVPLAKSPLVLLLKSATLNTGVAVRPAARMPATRSRTGSR